MKHNYLCFRRRNVLKGLRQKNKQSRKRHEKLRKDLFNRNFTKLGLDLRMPTTLLTVSILFIYFLYSYIFRDVVFEQVEALKDLIVIKYHAIFIIAVNASIVTLITLALPKGLSSIKIGGPDAKPEFSKTSWYAMLFSAGVSIGLLFYGVYEPLVHIDAPIFTSGADGVKGITTSVFHWALGGWGVYGVCGITLAYYAYNKGLPLAPRSFLYPLIKDRIYGFAGDVFDTIAIVSSLFGLASSLGLGALQINAGFKYIFGVPMSTSFQVLSIIFITFIATLSIVTGLKKGVRILSEVNVLFAGLLLFIVFLATPIGLSISNILASFILFIKEGAQTYITLGSYDVDFLSSWSIFYWAWWCSWSIFVGMFIAKISIGRTFREFVIAALLIPTFVSFLWFGVMGTAGQYIAQLYPESIPEMLSAPEVTMYALNNYLFDVNIIRILVNLLCLFLVFSFFITSSDSGSLVVDGLASAGKRKSPVVQKIFWASMEGFLFDFF